MDALESSEGDSGGLSVEGRLVLDGLGNLVNSGFSGHRVVNDASLGGLLSCALLLLLGAEEGEGGSCFS